LINNKISYLYTKAKPTAAHQACRILSTCSTSYFSDFSPVQLMCQPAIHEVLLCCSEVNSCKYGGN